MTTHLLDLQLELFHLTDLGRVDVVALDEVHQDLPAALKLADRRADLDDEPLAVPARERPARQGAVGLLGDARDDRRGFVIALKQAVKDGDLLADSLGLVLCGRWRSGTRGGG